MNKIEVFDDFLPEEMYIKCLEELHPLPNAYGNAVETFKTKEDAAKLLELLWDVEISEYEENNIHVWRLH